MNKAASSSSAGRELLTVDLGGLKSVLLQRAERTGTSSGALVRRALATALEMEEGSQPKLHRVVEKKCGRMRVSLRLTEEQGAELMANARHSGLSLGRYVAALLRTARQPEPGALKSERIAALTRSNAELATLSRNVAKLCRLLSQGSLSTALEYRRLLDVLDADVRAHLALVASLLAHGLTSQGREASS